MKKTFWWVTSILLIFSVIAVSFKSAVADKHAEGAANGVTNPKVLTTEMRFGAMVSDIYQAAGLQASGLDMGVFQKALTGFYNLKSAHKLPQNSNILTVVDFSKPSREKRLWIVDLFSKSLLLNTWVAHGQGSGDDMASHFSNNDESHQSSLGFYVTDDIYMGKHGRSLRLDGMDQGFNDHARNRAIVLHAADYVCQNTINQLGRLGRSFGCPAVSPEVVDQVIGTLKGKTAIFVNGPDSRYSSKYLDMTMAANYALPTVTDTSAHPITLRAAL
ncbi:murein L,D-transpeptidase catalytic domain family protein [Mucilaginibacter ginkgonis]|uniref:Murein L,D-transpeptidase catalytic domain family protein n=1 Tax=Mucilaginibacter ginkgonis TaxID=2682091 RepID=A0A6I4I5Y8_9SPHI|nr:murein L,D-transpeptidase catalytic domain family protein [Mucilaginibacter ginkgonis]QQL50491.1 murein L,D-transpeptidase catalytic domain family protein [Mucilaginibacter ginkgonis]